MLPYINTFNFIKLNVIKKSKFNYIRTSKKRIIVIKLLLKYNVITGYKFITRNKINFIKVYFNTNFPFFKLKNLCKLTNQRTLKHKHMLVLNNKYTDSKYILSTSKGLLELKEAIQLKIGGVLLFKIF